MKAFIAILFCAAAATADTLEALERSARGYGKLIPENPLELPLPSNDDIVRIKPPGEEEPVVAEEEVTMDPIKMLMMVVPGTPGVDYPLLHTIPQTSFSCDSVRAPFGYYADTDPASRCQVFHVCNDNIKSSFLCHNGSIFNQQAFVCDWWFNVDCNKQKEFYNLNDEIGVVPVTAAPANIGNNIIASSSNINNINNDNNINSINTDNNINNSVDSSSNGNGFNNNGSGSSNSGSGVNNAGLQVGASVQEPVIAEPDNAYLPPPDSYLPPPQSYLPPV